MLYYVANCSLMLRKVQAADVAAVNDSQSNIYRKYLFIVKFKMIVTIRCLQSASTFDGIEQVIKHKPKR